MITLVFSYSHADEELRNELEKHLTPLKRNGKISTWHDRRINPGQEFESQIEKSFSEANIILLLISSDFIASDYCYQVEMKNALQRHKNGEAVIIPVILRECAWHNLPFGHILAATIDGKPITKFASLDEGFVQVVNAVTCAIDNIRAKKPQQSMKNDPLVSVFSSSQVINTVRSSNLSLPKSFSDLDRDHTCREGFKYVSRYFENSLSELRLRNLGVEYDFQPDGDAFRCTIYINGRQAGRCGIWRNGNRSYGMGDICYSQDGITRNSYNESFIVTDNGQILGFRALMGGFSGTLKESLLTNEGMAEHLWDMFFNPIKPRAG